MTRQQIVAAVAGGVVAAACLVMFVAVPALSDGGSNPRVTGGSSGDEVPSTPAASLDHVSPAAVTMSAPGPDTSASASPTDDTRAERTGAPANGSPSPPATATAAAQLPIVERPIPFTSTRQAEMADYSQRHYGEHTVELDPQVIVLHYTAGGTADSVWSYFSQDVADGEYNELPGPVAHFIIAKDGTIYQLISTDKRGRHVVGLNHRSIGIEFVQEAGSSAEWADRQILARKKQCAAGLALVRYLMDRYGIAKRDVIGHAMANDHRLFKDLQGWHNTHGDWSAASVREFRSRL